MLMLRLLLLLLLLLCPFLLVNACSPTITLSAWRAVGDDGGVSVALYAGHRLHQLTLGVLWQRVPGVPDVPGSVLLPGTSPLLALDAPDDWYDGRSALTLERLTFLTRNHLFAWPVAAYSGTLVPPVTPAPTPVGGYLYLGPDSPVWLTYDLVTFTGAQLHFVPRRPGQLCDAAKSVAGARVLRADGRTVHRFAVRSAGTGKERAHWNVTLKVDFNAAQTYLPQEISSALTSRRDNHLHVDPQIDFATGADVEAAVELTALPGRGRQQVVMGRRSLRKLATAWTVNRQGDVWVWVASSESDDVPLEVLWVAAIAGGFLVIAAAHWISYLGHTLRLYYRPSRVHKAHESEVKVTTAHLVLGYFVLLASAVAHALMGVWGGHGQLANAPFSDPLQRLILAQWIGSLVFGLPFLVVLVLQTIHVARGAERPRRRHPLSAVPVQLFGIVMGTSAARGVVAALLVSAGMHLGVLFVTLIAALAFAFFATVYATLVLAAHLLGGVDLYGVPEGEKEPAWPILTWTILAQQLGLSVLVGVTFALWLATPWLDAMNSLYSTELVYATTMLFFAAPILLAMYLAGTQVRLLLGQEKKRRRRREKTR